MGRSQFLHCGLIALLVLAGCGDAPSLLVKGDVDAEVYGAGGAGGYGPTSTNETDFGTISGMVKFEGRATKPRNLKLSDKFCINSNPDGMASEEFLFDPATGALENVFVYIQRGVNKRVQDLHPVPNTPVVLDQVNCQYVPHTAFIRVGQPLLIKSSDNTLHNVAARPTANDPFNLTMNAPGTLPPRVFGRPESKPVLIKCDVHGWMRSYLAILPHPYCAITGKDGKFKLEGVPPGKYKLLFWHEKVGELAVDVELNNNEDKDQSVTMKRG